MGNCYFFVSCLRLIDGGWRVISFDFKVVTTGFWRATKLNLLGVFELLYPALNGSLGDFERHCHFASALAWMGLDVG